MLTTQKQGSAPNSATGKSQVGIPVIIAAVVLLVVFLGFMGEHYMVPTTPSLSQAWGIDKNSFPGWVNDAAMQCQGDMSKLSPDLQQKIAAQYKDGGRTEIMASYALQTH